MFLIIGLGNPGFKYRKTRHNVGFRALDYFREENNFPKFKLDKKSKAEISKSQISDQEVLLAKPQTYMNNSGEAIRAIFNFQFSKNLIVIHDDFDLPLGEIKITENSGSAGHHGIESIIKSLGTQNFTRVRIGIRPNYQLPTTNYQLNPKADNFVLKKFSRDEEKKFENVIKKACQEIEKIISLASSIN